MTAAGTESTSSAHARPTPGASVRETLTSLVIAFAMAFIFRGFVLEAFIIPTGSMAPTLLGAHMKFRSPQTGTDFDVGPWFYINDQENLPPLPVQGSPQHPVIVQDPMSGPPPAPGRSAPGGIVHRRVGVPREAGDRIFVLKYVEPIYNPRRFDVSVFKNPTQPGENYIKRLLGLPGEQIALVDGDVFFRQTDQAAGADIPWAGPGWRIARKPQRVQQDVWYTLFDSAHAPHTHVADYRSPWRASSGASDWTIGRTRVYRYEGDQPTGIRWDADAWPIDDYLAYNQSRQLMTRGAAPPRFPVSDLRMRLGVSFENETGSVRARLEARGHEFAADITGDSARLLMRPQGAPDWATIQSVELARPLRAGRVANIEFWHVDQALWLFIDGRRVAGGPENGAYDWNPSERIAHTTGRRLDDLLADAGNPFTRSSNGRVVNYSEPLPSWEFSGGPFTLHRVALDRDLYYRPADYQSTNHSMAGEPALATHPANTPTLGPDQFFVAGDNSAASLDGRLWDESDAWLLDTFPHAGVGVVPREVMIGKAFFVYFPSLQSRGGIPVPDAGRMRFIR